TAAAGAAEEVIDGIAAQVGTDIVLISEVNQMAAPVEERMRNAGAPPGEVARMRADILDRLIEGRLMADVVRRLELGASDAEVEDAIAGIAQDTGISVAQLQRSVASHGLTMDEYRAKIRDEIERSKVLNTMVRSRVRIEPDEVQALYAREFGDQPQGGEEVHLRHLLVAYGAELHRDQVTACNAAEEARAEIADGRATFAAVARRISDANPTSGGDMGWIHEKDLASWMVPAVKKLGDAGGISDVIETGFGCNLLEMVGRRDFQPVTFEQARPRIENLLMRQKMEVAYGEWVETLRAQTYIERKGTFSDAGAPGS
ncbi:MAG: SurA N-terminal domain-containing protein, partial [Proteobacteria bacterium]|nr:SurA N-terminal domain-containing protein [Pseudomonadota bacterium]